MNTFRENRGLVAQNHYNLALTLCMNNEIEHIVVMLYGQENLNL
jgi:hypothetical protein